MKADRMATVSSFSGAMAEAQAEAVVAFRRKLIAEGVEPLLADDLTRSFSDYSNRVLADVFHEASRKKVSR